MLLQQDHDAGEMTQSHHGVMKRKEVRGDMSLVDGKKEIIVHAKMAGVGTTGSTTGEVIVMINSLLGGDRGRTPVQGHLAGGMTAGEPRNIHENDRLKVIGINVGALIEFSGIVFIFHNVHCACVKLISVDLFIKRRY
jgi:hypothetical protein